MHRKPIVALTARAIIWPDSAKERFALHLRLPVLLQLCEGASAPELLSR